MLCSQWLEHYLTLEQSDVADLMRVYRLQDMASLKENKLAIHAAADFMIVFCNYGLSLEQKLEFTWR